MCFTEEESPGHGQTMPASRWSIWAVFGAAGTANGNSEEGTVSPPKLNPSICTALYSIWLLLKLLNSSCAAFAHVCCVLENVKFQHAAEIWGLSLQCYQPRDLIIVWWGKLMSASSWKQGNFRDRLEKRIQGQMLSYLASPEWCTGISIFQGVAARFSGMKMSQVFFPYSDTIVFRKKLRANAALFWCFNTWLWGELCWKLTCI